MTSQRTSPVAGLVGGVGSGKSTLARCAADRYGLAVVDGDAAGHRALRTPEVRTRIAARFGNAVVAGDGEIDRRALAKLVFGPTPERAAARRDLEAITHPVLRADFAQEIERHRLDGVPAVLLDAAVLLESGWQPLCDAVVFVAAPEPLRRRRVAEGRNWSEADWSRREASQMPVDEKRRRADAVVYNSGTPEEAADALAAVLRERFAIPLPPRAVVPA